jgi:hypothetical protein
MSECERQRVRTPASEAGAIGGRPSSEADDGQLDPAQRPLSEPGEGGAEGFEDGERELDDE